MLLLLLLPYTWSWPDALCICTVPAVITPPTSHECTAIFHRLNTNNIRRPANYVWSSLATSRIASRQPVGGKIPTSPLPLSNVLVAVGHVVPRTLVSLTYTPQSYLGQFSRFCTAHGCAQHTHRPHRLLDYAIMHHCFSAIYREDRLNRYMTLYVKSM